MSKQPIAYDYREDGRDYLISDKSQMEWDLIGMDLDWLEHFLTALEKLIEERETRDIADVENRHLGPIDWSEHYPWPWQDIIAPQLRVSYIVALMSVTERYLVRICADVGTILGTPIDLDDFKYGTLSHARKYLTKSTVFSAPAPATWDFVADVYRLRNIVVHNGGILDSDSKVRWVSEFVRRTRAPGLRFESMSVEIMHEFCRFAHKRIAEFFNELHREYAALCRDRRGHSSTDLPVVEDKTVTLPSRSRW